MITKRIIGNQIVAVLKEAEANMPVKNLCIIRVKAKRNDRTLLFFSA